VKRWLHIAAAVTLIALIAAAALNKISKAKCFTLTGHAICRVDTQQKLAALHQGFAIVGSPATEQP